MKKTKQLANPLPNKTYDPNLEPWLESEIDVYLKNVKGESNDEQ